MIHNNPKILARRAARLMLAGRFDTREFDRCFESGNGTAVCQALGPIFEATPEAKRLFMLHGLGNIVAIAEAAQVRPLLD